MSSQKPIIGIVVSISTSDNELPSYQLKTAYAQGVLDNGGIPLLLPISNNMASIEPYVTAVDGLLFAGGGDILPKYYGKSTVADITYVNETRDIFEIALVKEGVRQKKPMFGICRGLQVINVALGGTLIQDIPSQWENALCHAQDDGTRSELTQEVNLVETSLMKEIFQRENILVNTFHHQSIDELAPSLSVTATSSDGIIEAVESEDGLIFSVQWHPEDLYVKYPEFCGLFKILVEKSIHSKK